MLDNYKETQKIAYNILKNTLLTNKISHAYLIETMGNEDGFDFALSFAKALLCPNKYTNNKCCNNCVQCQTIDDNNFIEIEILDTSEMWLKKEKIIDLQKNFSLKPLVGKLKVYIIKNAEKIKESVFNSLLKFIEEPEEGVIAILITENKNNIIDTIISRCQLITLKNNSKDKNKILFSKEEIKEITVKFINYYEENKIDTILYTTSLIHDKLNDRTEYKDFFEIMIMYYSEILNFKINNVVTDFKKYEQKIISISDKQSIENIVEKINIIMNLKKSIANNVNLNLLIDKLLISFEKVK